MQCYAFMDIHIILTQHKKKIFTQYLFQLTGQEIAVHSRNSIQVEAWNKDPESWIHRVEAWRRGPGDHAGPAGPACANSPPVEVEDSGRRGHPVVEDSAGKGPGHSRGQHTGHDVVEETFYSQAEHKDHSDYSCKHTLAFIAASRKYRRQQLGSLLKEI